MTIDKEDAIGDSCLNPGHSPSSQIHTALICMVKSQSFEQFLVHHISHPIIHTCTLGFYATINQDAVSL